jgi:hypothetical protein
MSHRHFRGGLSAALCSVCVAHMHVVCAQTIKRVATSADLRDAIESSAQDVEVTQHLDLSKLTPEATLFYRPKFRSFRVCAPQQQPPAAP